MAVRASVKNVHRLIQTSTNRVAPTKSFVDDLKACIEKLDAQEARKPSQSYKPSSMNCIRNMYFQMVGAEQETERANACLVGICQSGTSRHEKIQEAVSKMKELGMDCEWLDIETYIKENNIPDLKVIKKDGFETKLLHTKLNMSFMCDGVIIYKGVTYILEIKTESMRKWVTREDVADEHKAQGTSYSVALLIDKVMFLYENRDNCDKKCYILNVAPSMKRDLVVNKIKDCDKYVASKTVPPMPRDITTKTCTYCKYKAECRKAK